MVKGQTELLKYNILTKTYAYIKLPSPLVIIQRDDSNKVKFQGLMDMGEWYVATEFSFYKNHDVTSMEMKTDLKFIKKDLLESSDKIINYLGKFKMSLKSSKRDENCHLFHTVDHLLAVSQEREDEIDKKRFKHSIDELIVMEQTFENSLWSGLLFFEKEGKKVSLLTYPLNFNSKAKLFVVYTSLYNIKTIRYQPESFEDAFYIADEYKYIKECTLTLDNEMPKIIVMREFFTPGFYEKNFDVGVSNSLWSLSSKPIAERGHFFIENSTTLYSGYDGIYLREKSALIENMESVTTLDVKGTLLYHPISSNN